MYIGALELPAFLGPGTDKFRKTYFSQKFSISSTRFIYFFNPKHLIFHTNSACLTETFPYLNSCGGLIVVFSLASMPHKGSQTLELSVLTGLSHRPANLVFWISLTIARELCLSEAFLNVYCSIRSTSFCTMQFLPIGIYREQETCQGRMPNNLGKLLLLAVYPVQK